MLAKMTSKNQLTLPKSVTKELGDPEYFEVAVKDGQLILTPMLLQPLNAIHEHVAKLNLTEQDVADAVAWARKQK
jgi:hypothetical protein